MCRVVLYIAFTATLQVLVDARTNWIFVLLFLCVFTFSPSCGLLIRLRSCGHPVRPWCFSFVDFRGNLPLLVDAACELALTLSQMSKFVVPKTSTVKVDAEQARMERAAVMAVKAGVGIL